MYDEYLSSFPPFHTVPPLQWLCAPPPSPLPRLVCVICASHVPRYFLLPFPHLYLVSAFSFASCRDLHHASLCVRSVNLPS